MLECLGQADDSSPLMNILIFNTDDGLVKESRVGLFVHTRYSSKISMTSVYLTEYLQDRASRDQDGF